ncbi:hypothetical protein BC827DRAFT_1193297 [Russula dissimulans]|nr:hypothetical protein BC827DRAFT_1193297 [Russula dissimulans]
MVLIILVICSVPAGWGAAGLIVPDHGAAVAPVPEITTLPQRVPGKRRRGVDDTPGEGNQDISHGHRPRPRKKGKAKMATTTGLLEADKPAARTPASINRKSKATRRGAERLATQNAQGQVSMGAIVQEEQSCVEGSVEGATGHYTDSVVPRQDNTGSSVFYIPRSLDTRQRALLKANSDEWARGTVRVIKCRLCPESGLKDFEVFKRHCNTGEAHPVSISYCEHCGDFFARIDSLHRHCDKRPAECHDVSPAKAEIKRLETGRVLREFEKRLVYCLKNDEDIGKPFADIIKEMYPESSKKGSR